MKIDVRLNKNSLIDGGARFPEEFAGWVHEELAELYPNANVSVDVGDFSPGVWVQFCGIDDPLTEDSITREIDYWLENNALDQYSRSQDFEQ